MHVHVKETGMAMRVIRMPMTKARINLGALVRGVHVRGDVVVLEKDGIPVAGLVDIDALEDLIEINDPKMQRKIRASMKAYRQGKGRPAREFLEELKTGAGE
jgi:antitoxin (DNA-binding transcriptional repressor) of toxin-antitoxin stability system